MKTAKITKEIRAEARRQLKFAFGHCYFESRSYGYRVTKDACFGNDHLQRVISEFTTGIKAIWIDDNRFEAHLITE